MIKPSKVLYLYGTTMALPHKKEGAKLLPLPFAPDKLKNLVFPILRQSEGLSATAI